MTNTRLRVFAVTALLSVAGAVLGSVQDTTLQEIAGYRQWARLTAKPMPAFSIDGSAD